MGRRTNLPPRVGIIQDAIDHYDDARYLEIGVFLGTVFFNVRAGSKVAVDPVRRIPRWKPVLHPGGRRARFVWERSDDYFEHLSSLALRPHTV